MVEDCACGADTTAYGVLVQAMEQLLLGTNAQLPTAIWLPCARQGTYL